MDNLVNLPIINKSVLFSAPMRSGHSHFKEKLNKVNINGFPQTCQRAKFAGHTATHKSEETFEHRVTAQICLFGTEAAEATKWQEDSNFDDFLEPKDG